MVRVYVDQCHLLRPETRRLRAMALRGVIVAPTSAAHIVETLRDKPAKRAEMGEALVDLCRGYFIDTEVGAALVEAEARQNARGNLWAREQMLTRDAWHLARTAPVSIRQRITRWINPVAPSAVFGRLEAIGSMQAVNAAAKARLAEGADRARALRPAPTVREILVKLGVGLEPLVATMSDDELRATFRAATTREALQNEIWRAQPQGFAANDFMDVFFLAAALPYCDAVCIDSRMNERIRQARKNVPFEWGTSFANVAELLDWLEAGTVTAR